MIESTKALNTSRPVLMLVTDRHRVGGVGPLFDRIAAAIDAGVDVVQVRETDMTAPELSSFLGKLKVLTAGRVAIVVNSAVDIALKLGLGIHLRETAPALTATQSASCHSGALVGRSIHGPVGPVEEQLSYYIFGHVYTSGSKPGLQPRGLPALRSVATSTSIPVLAIGGISQANTEEVILHGAAGVAVIGAILDAVDAWAATRELRNALDRAAADGGGGL